jgi:hypothetical protein
MSQGFLKVDLIPYNHLKNLKAGPAKAKNASGAKNMVCMG